MINNFLKISNLSKSYDDNSEKIKQFFQNKIITNKENKIDDYYSSPQKFKNDPRIKLKDITNSNRQQFKSEMNVNKYKTKFPKANQPGHSRSNSMNMMF